MQVKELGHLVLFVRNLEVSARFYRDVLGWAPIGPALELGGGRAGAAAFSSGRTHHELLLIEVGEDLPPIGRERRVGLYHFGLKVGESDEELRAALAVLRAENVTVVGTADHTVTHSAYILDPDGNEVELYIDVPGVDWHDAAMVLAATKPLQLG